MRDIRTIAAKVTTAIVAALVVLGAMMWLSGFFRRDQIQPAKLPELAALAPAKTVAVEQIKRLHEADVVGSVQAELRTTIAPRLTANILQINVRAGDKVAKGQVLVLLDDRDVKSRVEQAKEVLRSAEATRDMAKIEFDRLSAMVEQNVASEYELDQWRTKYTTARADVQRAQEAIGEAEVALSDAQILAPFEGVVVDRQAEPGDLAAPGKALLTIYNPSHLRLEASVREAYIGRLALNQQMAVYIDALRQQRQGLVEEIVPAADPSSRSFLVKVHLVDAAGLYPGMFGRMRVPLEEEEHLVVPNSAIERIGQLNLVTVVTSQWAQRRSVRIGHEFGEKVEVLSGLREGDRVVVRGE